MNRRDFLTATVLVPFFTQELFAIEDNINTNNSKILKNSIYLKGKQWDTLVSLHHRLNRLKRYVGFANFNLLSFKEALFYSKNYPKIGSFTKDELKLIDQIFYDDPKKYSFYGQKTCFDINNTISKKLVTKIPHTGHFIFKGKPLEDYKRLKKDIGDSLVLTSGVRNVVKQLNLYCAKIYKFKGNITKASNSIAPPAYSYHTTSDFDVGKKGFGYDNFTARFATTKEFKEIIKLDYISMRYTVNNKDGVRYEPWHIKVI